MADVALTPPPLQGRRKVYRHALVVRITHWVNVLCLFFLLLSGLQIFNAHPYLYWGDTAVFENNVPVDPLIAMDAYLDADGQPVGRTRIFGMEFDTTGFLGLSTYNGQPEARGFPSWLTIPSWRDLATGRLWHFLFAWIFVINGLVYLIYGVFSRHVWRDLVPSRSQWRHIGRSIVEHLRLRFPRGEEATVYNILQKLAYLGAILALALIVITGLSMSPGMNAAVPWLPELFGGRQSARTIHFFAATAVVVFTFVHVVMVLLSGVFNNLRSMITGRYVIREDRHAPPPQT